MQERDQKSIQTKKPVVLMGELDIIVTRILTTIQRDRALEEGPQGGHHTVGLLLDPICLHFWMENHKVTTLMNYKTTLRNMLGNMRS